jgi:hypothetical protein
VSHEDGAGLTVMSVRSPLLQGLPFIFLLGTGTYVLTLFSQVKYDYLVFLPSDDLFCALQTFVLAFSAIQLQAFWCGQKTQVDYIQTQ